MTSKRQAEKIAKALGAEIEYDNELGQVEAWLPEGKEWQESGGQCVIVGGLGYIGNMKEAWTELIGLMNAGIL